MNCRFLPLLLLIWAPPPLAAADSGDPQAAIEAGRAALRNSQSYPWYDADRDDIRRIDVELPKQPPSSSWNWGLSGLADVLRIAGWLALALLLCLIAYFLVRTFLARETASAAHGAHDGVADGRSELDRVESLPFRIQRPLSNLLGEAERHYREGNYDEAIIYLYSYQLVELDRHQVIRLARGKTNRQYLREARARSGVGDLLQQTMVVFEDAFFGGHAISRARFEEVYRQMDEFHQLLEQVAA